jgi:hypothetical protein
MQKNESKVNKKTRNKAILNLKDNERPEQHHSKLV